LAVALFGVEVGPRQYDRLKFGFFHFAHILDVECC
jgi:hypothetical protein